MFEFVLVVSLLNDFSDPEYVGHFSNCDVAMEYKDQHYPEHKSARCLLQQYINLPKGLVKKEVK